LQANLLFPDDAEILIFFSNTKAKLHIIRLLVNFPEFLEAWLVRLKAEPLLNDYFYQFKRRDYFFFLRRYHNRHNWLLLFPDNINQNAVVYMRAT